MKAAVLTGIRTLSMEERELPRAGKGEIVVRVRASAVCGTDIRMWNNASCALPRILGHEIAGDVYEIGEGVNGYAIGQRVAIAPNMGCGICDECVSGRTHLCPTYKALGINLDGGFAEFVKVPAEAVRQGNVCPIGDATAYDQAAIVEPFSCVYNAFETYRVHPADKVLIIGAGPIGCMHAILAKMAGASDIFMTDLSEKRLDDCQKRLPYIKPYCGSELKQFIMDSTKNKGVDVCVTACPSPEAQEESLELMNMFGRVCFFGGLPASKEPVRIDTNLVHYRHLILCGTSRSSLSQYRKCLSLIENGVVDLKPLITDKFTLDEVPAAFDYASKAGGLKSVIEM